jgi:uncharacterized membrane protein YraQ (UPF0718 family)
MWLAWSYWCSMLLGASPFLSIGAFTAAYARERWRHSAAGVLAACFFLPGCDCTINALSLELGRLPQRIAAFAVTWGACCNPLALAMTYVILGPHLAWCRAACGLTAATCTSLAWFRPGQSPVRREHACGGTLASTFVAALNEGLRSFCFASAIACLVLAFASFHRTSDSGFVAAALGAVLSPCSIADALLARVLFVDPKAQLAFVVAAQCLDLRQTAMLVRTFGLRRAGSALASCAGACALGYALA